MNGFAGFFADMFKDFKHMRTTHLMIAILLASILAMASDKAATNNIYNCKTLGEMTDQEISTYLNLIGGDQDPNVIPKASSLPPWKHSEHQFGFLPINVSATTLQQVIPAHSVTPNTNLSRIDIRLDRLRVSDYPGKGRHFVLLTFLAQNSPTNSRTNSEAITFSQTYEIQEGEGAGISGYPVFNGLNINRGGCSFRCITVNVKNERDENALSFLKSGPVSQGLTLLTTANPAIAPFTELTKGIGEMLLTRNENVKVQDFYLGLDFQHGGAFGARLSEGNYIVVQAPDNEFSWDDWAFRPSDGRIINKNSKSFIAFNYIVFRVSAHND